MKTTLIYEDGRKIEIEAPCAAMISIEEPHGVERHFSISALGVYREVPLTATIRMKLNL